MKTIQSIRGLITPRLMVPAAAGTAAVAVVAVVAAVLVHIFGGDAPEDRNPDSIAGGIRSEVRPTLVAFDIAGDASGTISPGVSVPIDFVLKNPHETAMTISGLRVVVNGITAPQATPANPCGVADFTVDQVASGRKIILSPGSASTLSALGLPRTSWPQVGMRDRSVNQDGCKGASLSLAYTASGLVPSQ